MPSLGALRTAGRRAVVALVVSLAAVLPLQAQTGFDPAGPIPPADIPNVDPLQPSTRALPGAGDGLDPAFGPLLPDTASPYAPSNPAPDLGLDFTPIVAPELLLSAKLVEDGAPLRSGVVWRVFAEAPGPDGVLPLVAQANGGIASFKLDPGVYLVHCGFGFAGTTDRVEVKAGLVEEALVLNAGGIRLQASAIEERPLPGEDLRFDVFSPETDERGERMIIARDIRPGELVRLAAGTYTVVSRYGTVNAQTHADVEVKAGKLAEIMLYQKAAEVTLKLVGEPGGEAIADTRWSILTPGGDIVTEGVGAFPSFILAAGGYTVIAKHADQVFERRFEVAPGFDAEVEVLATAAAAAAAGPTSQ